MKIDLIHKDDRGAIYSLTGGFTSFPEVSVFATNAGYARGGCIHRISHEHLCVLDGQIKYVYGDDTQEVILDRGDNITIGPNTPHYFLSITDSLVMEWGPLLAEKQEKHIALRAIVNENNDQVGK